MSFSSGGEAGPGGMTLTELWTYPIKSVGGVRLTCSAVEPRGLEHDRRWMLVDARGELVTQRQHPKMRVIEVSLRPQDDAEHVLLVEAPGMSPLLVPRRPDGARVAARVWNDATSGLPVSAQASAWFSSYLGLPCVLLHMPDDDARAQQNKPFTSLLSFADGNPFHLVSETSVADLNTRLERPVVPLTFRPNLVVSGELPYAEDFWRLIRVGPLQFQVVESCARCSVLNVSPQGEMTAEPLRTLARLRRRGKAVPFGQNMLQGAPYYRAGGVLEVGMPVVVVERAEVPNPSYE
ncbi:MOSC domain-containing protein [Deinococcus altitudinis]|uniref:MOSC domain-containing protein n=1 Tax=Deinococcus altitudinis TaxID=468914 RepID=UPI00389282C1